MCRIVLEDIPGVLRSLFKNKISNKVKQKWIDGQKCGRWLLQQEIFQARLNSSQKQLLSSGQTSEWDVTLLVHTLLYSSQLLLAHSFNNNQVGLKHNDPFKLVSVLPHVNFTSDLHHKDIILCDLGQELIRNEVKYVSRTEITLKYPVKFPNMPPTFPIYICSRDWMAVEDLSKLRNVQFAHCKNARIDVASLKVVIQKIEALYMELRVPQQRISSMTAILKGIYSFHECVTY